MKTTLRAFPLHIALNVSCPREIICGNLDFPLPRLSNLVGMLLKNWWQVLGSVKPVQY